MEHQHLGNRLTYFVTEKSGILIVSFRGNWTREGLPVIEYLITDLEIRTPKWVIVDFKEDMETMESALFPHFTRMQKLIRDKGALLKISGLNHFLKKTLTEHGLIRPEETAHDLAEALQLLNGQQAA